MIDILYVTCLRDLYQFRFSINSLKICTDINKCKFTFIVSDEEFIEFKSIIYNLDLPHYRVFTHSKLLNQYNFIVDRDGWHRQMFLKLIYSNMCESDYYLCIDSDIVFYKPFTENNLFINNKYAYTFEEYRYSSDLIKNWVREAEKILNFSIEHKSRILTTNPVIFDTDICRELLNLMSDNRLILSSSNWSEYTLYSTYLYKIDRFYNLYTEMNIPLNTWYLNIWSTSDINNFYNYYKQKRGEGISFAVQSYLYNNSRDKIESLYNYINNVINDIHE